MYGPEKPTARFRAEDIAGEEAFRQAQGEVEFTVDAGKVNTREESWKDLKIAVLAKREAGDPMSPEQWKSQRLPLAAMVPALEMIASSKQFRKSWRPRLWRPGERCLDSVQVLADAAGWIGMAVGGVRIASAPSGGFQNFDCRFCSPRPTTLPGCSSSAARRAATAGSPFGFG